MSRPIYFVEDPINHCDLHENKDIMKAVRRNIRPNISVDQWEPQPEDELFKTTKISLNIEFSKMFGFTDTDFDNFILSTKRCYNGKDMRYHLPLYLNYFEKFYDPQHELIMVMYNIKYMIDYFPEYNDDVFRNDLNRYIFRSVLSYKAYMMVEDNYNLELDQTKYKNDKNHSLVYKDICENDVVDVYTNEYVYSISNSLYLREK